MHVWCDWQVTLCDPHLSTLEVRFSRRCSIQIDVYLTLHKMLYSRSLCYYNSDCVYAHVQEYWPLSQSASITSFTLRTAWVIVCRSVSSFSAQCSAWGRRQFITLSSVTRKLSANYQQSMLQISFCLCLFKKYIYYRASVQQLKIKIEYIELINDHLTDFPVIHSTNVID